MNKALELQFLCERIYGKLSTGYHRTRLSGMEALAQKGELFAEPTGGMYGPGIYMTYDLQSQMKDYMRSTYGDYLIECAVNLDHYLIFDPDVASTVYGPRNIHWVPQLVNIFHINPRKFLGSDYEYFNGQDPSTVRWTSTIAQELIDTVGVQKLMRLVRGIVFTGAHDGRVIVAYDHKSIKPLRWKYENGGTETPHTEDEKDELRSAGLAHLIVHDTSKVFQKITTFNKEASIARHAITVKDDSYSLRQITRLVQQMLDKIRVDAKFTYVTEAELEKQKALSVRELMKQKKLGTFPSALATGDGILYINDSDLPPISIELQIPDKMPHDFINIVENTMLKYFPDIQGAPEIHVKDSYITSILRISFYPSHKTNISWPSATYTYEIKRGRIGLFTRE